MKNKLSLFACITVCLIMLAYRISYSGLVRDKPLKVISFDVFGYYMYLPSMLIYHDVTELNWLPEIENEYEVTGGYLYQSNKCDNGNYVNKYLGGVAILQLPFFLAAHVVALNSGFKADGFSPPYQYASALAGLFYCILAMFLLRRILLKYFDDLVVAITILLLVLASNMIQYTSIDSAMSHAYIFPLYVLIIYVTIKWHEKPKIKWAMAIGFIIGLATISRPTEAIMFFIPLLWNTQTKEKSREKWQLVKQYKSHLIFVLAFGLIGILPQLIYWKYTTGSFVYNVGSKWAFLNPWFRVLFGFEKGWFIYTPVTILFVAGLFFVKRFPFRYSVIVFCLINIWVIIAWFDWQYGGAYSTRALMQSYPVFALPLAAIVDRAVHHKIKYVFYPVGAYLILVNVFQLYQYNNFFLHYRDMNRLYYGAIYLNPDPSPADMSLLDTDEIIRNEKKFESKNLWGLDAPVQLDRDTLVPIQNSDVAAASGTERWIKVDAVLSTDSAFYQSYIHCDLVLNDSVKHKRFRIFSPLARPEKMNPYTFYVRVPEDQELKEVDLFISSDKRIQTTINRANISLLTLK
ncbi:MAG: hypothetical protein GC181_09205 [Bacteroidetes bacterium]|nr:hypothetical protein [Bacteroidota bacterium]